MELELITDEEIALIKVKVEAWFGKNHPMFDGGYGNKMILCEFLANEKGKTFYEGCVGREF